MTDELLGNDEWRERFVRYCVECGKDTMPHDRTGRCMFCDTLLVAPAEPAVRMCGNGLHEMTEENTSHLGSQRRRCRACMRAAWRRSADRRRDAA